ncbi:MAG: hypothetical protein IKR92_05105 [Alphaproteobacteria bacterium]|nr:hypothetical protein [Alphaproteobacteria bacterium]
MVTTKSKNSVKMVMISGMLVPESKVEGRLRALAHGRNLKAQLAEDQKKADKRLADDGFSPEDIACLRHANRIKTMEAMGLGKSTRIKRITFPA